MIRKTLFFLGTCALAISGCSSNSTGPSATPPHFTISALAANNASYGAPAANVDANLQDAWGLAFSTQSGYASIANRGSGTSTIYDTLGAPKTAVYHVNGLNHALGSPTGIVQNSATTTFLVPAAGTNASWIFAEQNGTIAAIASGAPGDSTFIAADRSPSSSFTGLAMATTAGNTLLFAANVRNGSLDAFDTSFHIASQKPGQEYNTGYTPFNVVALANQLFVADAKMSGSFVAVGPGSGGYVDLYDLKGNFQKTLIKGDSLDSPWGMAIAPSGFGPYSGDLLVGNYGDGKIHAYNLSSGALDGTLMDAQNNPVVIPGLWALVVYNGTLYFTAGPNGTDGEFGTIKAQ